jgi:hypothetical protein
MAFYFRSHSAGGGAFYYRSNEVRGTQTVIGVDIITDVRSAFFNLDFVPVDGDSVTLPTVFQGSTITLTADGLYTIDPALPAGTQIPRTSFDASENATYNDFIIVFDDTGEIVTVSGTGTMTVTGAGSESALGAVFVDSIASITATGSAQESVSRDAAIDSVGTITAAGSSVGISTGDALINSVASVIVTGSIVIDPGLMGDVVISGSSSLLVAGSGGLSFRSPINRIFLFD